MIPWWLVVVPTVVFVVVFWVVRRETRLYRRYRRGVDVDLVGLRAADEWPWPEAPSESIDVRLELRPDRRLYAHPDEPKDAA